MGMRRWGCSGALRICALGRALVGVRCAGWLLVASLGSGVLVWMPRDVRRPCS